MYKSSLGSRMFDLFNGLFMLLLVVVMLYPFMHVVAISLSTPEAISAGKVGWLPKGFNMEGYRYVLNRADLWIAYRNTLLYTAGSCFFVLLFTSLMAYPLAVREFKAQKAILFYLVVTMFFNGGIIPTFLVIRELNLLNTFWVMVLPGAVSAFTVIIFRTFFRAIPYEYRESAFMDGANDFRILFSIYMPLSKPLLATFGLFTMVAAWNEWFSALIYLKNENLFPVQILLRKILILEQFADSGSSSGVVRMEGNISPRNIQMAVTLVAMFPILVVYPFAQKYFVKGIMIGGIKG
ncbi:ABC transporter permease [Paenibacillus agaridevorans]|jgi:putative aldouronate transport system permease protein|uniref:ABC transporter permease n=1 Tax=Paenibacillus agaridevorans TaxID=171404 RepID=A0A2R5ENC1_9BACL|nr:carbohydrate ABC transporter permease [Paenibacillus agaridevorans]GBG06488.1 ABC transporter permease [Paenibacillus agaridevorans]